MDVRLYFNIYWTEAPSDHAKKVQQELAKQAKSKSKAKAAKEESKEEGDNEEDDDDDGNEESESEESGGEEADGKAKTSGKQQANKVATGRVEQRMGHVQQVLVVGAVEMEQKQLTRWAG